ncbi:hypothetical protein ES705_44009 [subsurface metagenome]
MLNPIKDKEEKGSDYTWYCESDNEKTYIYANFHQYDPNKEKVEINVRKTCFYPTWIIENNIISNSRCAGITLGKDRKSGNNVGDPADNGRVPEGVKLYNEIVDIVIKKGWNKELIGSHVVRNNEIFDCGQAGICGSLGAIFNENVYLNGAKHYQKEQKFVEKKEFNPKVRLENEDGKLLLYITYDKAIGNLNNKLVTTDLLGKTFITRQQFEKTDGSPIAIVTDFFEKKRNNNNPMVGPFEHLKPGINKLKVW